MMSNSKEASSKKRKCFSSDEFDSALAGSAYFHQKLKKMCEELNISQFFNDAGNRIVQLEGNVSRIQAQQQQQQQLQQQQLQVQVQAPSHVFQQPVPVRLVKDVTHLNSILRGFPVYEDDWFLFNVNHKIKPDHLEIMFKSSLYDDGFVRVLISLFSEQFIRQLPFYSYKNKLYVNLNLTHNDDCDSISPISWSLWSLSDFTLFINKVDRLIIKQLGIWQKTQNLHFNDSGVLFLAEMTKKIISGNNPSNVKSIFRKLTTALPLYYQG